MIDAIAADLVARHGPVGPIAVELGDPTDPDSRFKRTLRLNRPATLIGEAKYYFGLPVASGSIPAIPSLIRACRPTHRSSRWISRLRSRRSTIVARCR